MFALWHCLRLKESREVARKFVGYTKRSRLSSVVYCGSAHSNFHVLPLSSLSLLLIFTSSLASISPLSWFASTHAPSKASPAAKSVIDSNPRLASFPPCSRRYSPCRCSPCRCSPYAGAYGVHHRQYPGLQGGFLWPGGTRQSRDLKGRKTQDFEDLEPHS